MYRYIPVDMYLLLNVGVYQGLQICIVNSCLWGMSWSRVSFSSWHTLIPFNATMVCHPAEADMGNFVAQGPEEIHNLANKRVFSIFAHNCLQARHWVRVDCAIMLYRIHVPIIVQYQCDGCCLSSKECRERFPRHRLQRKLLVSDPGMHHGTCVTHVS